MPDEPEARDLGSAWRELPEEKIAVSLEQFVKRRARELHSRTRSETITSIGAALFLVAVIAWRFASSADRLQQLAMGVVLAWVLISLYWFRGRIWRSAPAAPDALAATGLEHYRRELAERRDHLRNAWLWHGPLVLGCLILAVIIFQEVFPGRERLLRVSPLLIVLAVWTAFNIARRRSLASELQRELEALNAVETVKPGPAGKGSSRA